MCESAEWRCVRRIPSPKLHPDRHFLHALLSPTYTEIFPRFDPGIFVTDGIVKLLSKRPSKRSGKRCSRMETSDCPSLQMDKPSHEKNLGQSRSEQKLASNWRQKKCRNLGTSKLGRRLLHLGRSSALSVDVANMCGPVIWIIDYRAHEFCICICVLEAICLRSVKGRSVPCGMGRRRRVSGCAQVHLESTRVVL